eukprot:jgi/Psemu1/48102/gm1.48102_g
MPTVSQKALDICIFQPPMCKDMRKCYFTTPPYWHPPLFSVRMTSMAPHHQSENNSVTDVTQTNQNAGVQNNADNVTDPLVFTIGRKREIKKKHTLQAISKLFPIMSKSMGSYSNSLPSIANPRKDGANKPPQTLVCLATPIHHFYNMSLLKGQFTVWHRLSPKHKDHWLHPLLSSLLNQWESPSTTHSKATGDSQENPKFAHTSPNDELENDGMPEGSNPDPQIKSDPNQSNPIPELKPIHS